MKKKFFNSMGLCCEDQQADSFKAELSESFEIVASILQKLGDDKDVFLSYLIHYLQLINVVAFDMTLVEAADRGSMYIQGLIRTDDELVKKSEKLSAKFPNVDVREDFLYIATGHLLPYAVRDYAERLGAEIEGQIDKSVIPSQYESICKMLGGSSDIDLLNEKLITTFVKILPLEFYRQGIISDMLYTLYYDREDSEETVLHDVLR